MIEKTVLITGASGLLGRAVYKYFTDESFRNEYPIEDLNSGIKWNCVGLCNKRIKEKLKPLDLTNFELVKTFIDELKPDALIHCAAEKRVEVVENDYENTVKINCDSTSFLADICAKNGIVFVYISTDYVFDGKLPPYKIDAETNPLNKYGITKLQGEVVTKKASSDHLIVRVPVLYGYTEENGFKESAINFVYELIKDGNSVKLDNVQTRFPTNCIDVARFCMNLLLKRFLVDNGNMKIKGIFHCSALEPFTKYEMSCIIADEFNLNKQNIKPDNTIVENSLRPMNSKLETEYSYSLLNFKPVIKFRESIKDCLQNFVA